MEYKRDEDWQPICYYAPSLEQSGHSAVTLNNDNTSVTAQSMTYAGSLPLHLVDTSQPTFYREYIKGLFLKQLRWSQWYFSMDLEQDRASWSIDNVTVIKWDGLCTKTLLLENFENSNFSR